MKKTIHNAFDNVHTSQSLKDSTMNFLAQQKTSPVQKNTAVLRQLTAACLTFILLVSGLTTLYFIPVSAIHIDTGPASANLKINCFNRVVAIDGTTKNTDLQHMKYEDAVSCMLDKNDSEDTVITVVGNEKILAYIEANVSQNENVHCGHLSAHAAKQAERCGMSAAKYELYLTLLQNGIDITPQEAQQIPMKTLRTLLKTQTDEPIPTQPNTTVYDDCPTDTSECESSLHHQNGQHHGHGH